MKTPPCKGCPERAERCHGKCTKYGAWKTDLDAENERKRKKKDADGSTYDYIRRLRKYHWNRKGSKKQ